MCSLLLQGCFEKVEEWLDDNKHLMGTVAMVILVVQVKNPCFVFLLFLLLFLLLLLLLEEEVVLRLRRVRGRRRYWHQLFRQYL